MKNNYNVIGLMSGTSLDGLDIACTEFAKTKKGWQFEIKKATTLAYSPSWTRKLSTAQQLSGLELIALDFEYGLMLGKVVRDFMLSHKLNVDFIASHGHTVFHQPQRNFTYQLGNGNALYSIIGLPVVYDFRSLDVLLGGEGAPLVPAGDRHLFSSYDVCLNLGGIANLSMEKKRQRIAYDICFCNMGLNYLMREKKKTFDAGGELASRGEVQQSLLRRLNKVYAKLKAKRPSLGREIFEKEIQPLLDNKEFSLQDRLRTSLESTAMEIAAAVLGKENPTVLCTGGGAFNSFLMARILEHCGDAADLIMPDDDVIKFKEAVVFAFLGVLRVRDENNCLQSVTGASRNSSGGVLVGF